MKRFNRAIILLLALALTVGALAGCTPKPPVDPDPTPGPTTSTGKTDWVIWNTITSEMETFNFQYSQNAKELDILSNCFDGLTTNDPYGTLVPCIATDWNSPDGGKNWVFNLRQGAKWVDYQGNEKGEVKAEDWLWGLEWVLNFAKNDAVNTSMPKELLKGATEYYEYTKELGDAAKDLGIDKMLEMVGIAAPDEYTVTFECLDTFPYFQTVTVYNCLFPISGDFLAEVGVDGYRSITHDKLWYNGPYTITHYVQGNEKVLTKNPLWWDTESTRFNTVTVKMLESSDVAFQMFQNGELDVISLTEANLQTIYRDPDHKYYKHLVEARPSKYSYQVHIQFDKKLEGGAPDTNWNTALANTAFRKAWYYGIDWTDYLGRVNAINPLKCTNLCYTSANLVTHSNGKDYTDLVMDNLGMRPSLDGYVRYDGDKFAQYKQQALDELTPKGVTFPVEIDYYIAAGNQTSLDSATVLKNMFEGQLGEDFVKFNIKTYVSSFAQEVRNPQLFSIVISGWGADFGDPINYLGQEIINDDNAYYTTSTSNANNVTDPELRAIYQTFTDKVNAAKAITDNLDRRFEAFADAEAYMIENVLVLPIYLNIPWQLTHANDYSKVYCAYGTQNVRWINWETSEDLFTTEQYESFSDAYERGKGN